jgi:hypothetical protein
MPKRFTQEEREAVKRFASEGLTNTKIAENMATMFPANWNNKSGHRAVARILIDEQGKTMSSSEKTLDEMTRGERFDFIKIKLQSTPRFRMALDKFQDTEKEMFVDEYLRIIKSIDTLTEVEEQALFASIIEFVLAFQALGRKEQEEQYYADSMSGKIQDTDRRFRRHVDEQYQKEYDQHMKLYQAGIKNLKMSREQRLKEVRSERLTLVDLAQELSSQTVQASVADEISHLSKLRDEELKKMLDNGHLHGVFDD